MYRAYGRAYGKCADCCNFVSGRYHNKVLQKCKAYGLTHSEASDWRKKWNACGLFNVPFESLSPKRRPIIELKKYATGKRADDYEAQIDGQTKL